MHAFAPRDSDGVDFDWSRTSEDYARHRAGYPERFYRFLAALGVGRPGQRVLDLATGTGIVARALAARGCRVCGVDVAPGQIDAAKQLAAEQGLTLDLRIASAEETGYEGRSFDAITASQCWPYFERDRAVREVRRLLDAGGLLATSHLSWLPRLDPIAAASEALVLEHHPGWSAGGWSGEVPVPVDWAGEDFDLVGHFVFDEPIEYTREGWRGRFRACRGVGASLAPGAVRAFDEAHAALLERIAPEQFTILHRIDAHVLAPRA